jgi:hypothetical protein
MKPVSLTQEQLGKGNEGQGQGLEISIQGLIPETSIWIEYHEGKVQLHVWSGTAQDPQTIILT